MRKLSVLMLAFVAGSLLFTPLSAGGGGKHAKPFYGNVSGSLGEFVYDRIEIAERCEEPDRVWTIAAFEGSGIITHLGRSDVSATHCSYGVILGDGTIEPDGTYGQGELITTAANGDILLATYENGTSYPVGSLIGFEDEFTFVNGGTGRFTFASGGGIEIGTVSFADGAFSVELLGEISYKRKMSNKRK